MKYKNKYVKSDHPNDVIVNKWRHEDKLMFQSKKWPFSNGFSTWKHLVHACLSTIFNYDVYDYIVKIVLEQNFALYYQRQNMNEKWKYFHLLAKLQKVANFCDFCHWWTAIGQ